MSFSCYMCETQCNRRGVEIVTVLLTIIKTFQWTHLETTEIQDHSACRKVYSAGDLADCKWVGGLCHHVCSVVSLPQVCPLVTSFKCVTCRTQLALSFFQGGINVFIAGPYIELAHLRDIKKETFQTLTVLNNVNTLITRSRQTKLGSIMTETEQW